MEALGQFLGQFFERSLFTGTAAQDSWASSWTIFYWAWWFAWAPIVGVFLGRISYGYSVRQFMFFNLLLPALFGAVWMSIFGGTAIELELYESAELVGVLNEKGPEGVMYALMTHFPGCNILVPVFLFVTFISLVTAADSTTSAMSSLSSKDITLENPEPSKFVKIAWGVMMGLVAWIMICFADIEGIKILSVLGGLPALMLCLALVGVLIKMAANPKKYEGPSD